MANIEELEKIDASEIYLRRINAKKYQRHKWEIILFSPLRMYSKIVGKRSRIPRIRSKTGTSRRE